MRIEHDINIQPSLQTSVIYHPLPPFPLMSEEVDSKKTTGSLKASYRRFMAEQVTPIYETRIQPTHDIPSIHYSDSSGELRQMFLQQLREAKTSIECLTFTFSDPEIIELLLQKANEGIKVTVVIDKNHMNSLLPYRDKISLVTRNTGEGRIHHKISVIDGEKVWIGSANFSPDAYIKQSNTMIFVSNKNLAQALHEEIEACSGLRPRTPSPLPPIQIGGQTIELLLFPHVPFGVNNPPEKALNEAGKRRIIELIDKATTRLRFAVCVWTDPDLARAVVNAKKRGVDVEVVIWKKEESPDIVRLFQQENIPIIEKPHLPLMHNKWMLVDEEHFFNGSANWSKSWFSRNDESGLIISGLDKTQAESLIEYWKKLRDS